MQKLDGYMLVHVPESAAAGDVFTATTPSGAAWAFKVPATLPQDRIIELRPPDLKDRQGSDVQPRASTHYGCQESATLRALPPARRRVYWKNPLLTICQQPSADQRCTMSAAPSFDAHTAEELDLHRQGTPMRLAAALSP